VGSHEWHKAAAIEDAPMDAIGSAFEQPELLLMDVADGDNEAAAHPELLKQSGRHVG
jgi:hypothetical protein